jgi:UDP-N-acetylmuramoyl-L-alanyl-D-glutamate--2,6-diaminopimelate ligase
MSLLEQLKQQGIHPAAVTADSRQVRSNSLFLAYPGERVDGRQFIAQAIAQGASAVAYEPSDYAANYTWTADDAVAHIAMQGLRQQVGNIADEYYAHPSSKLWMIGVTGTNGKTTCSQWLAQALQSLQRKTAVIGTLGNGFLPALSVTINTTPDPIQLHAALADYLAQGAQAVAMEVSSHGLQQGRVNGVAFDVAVLTNLSRDHLDYHGDMASYAAAKQRLFAWPNLHSAVLNADDAFGQSLAAELAARGQQVLSYGLHSGDVRGTDLRFNHQGLAMQVHTPFGSRALQTQVTGHFNAYNLLAVLATLLVSQVSLDDAVQALSQLQAVAGRMQQYGGVAEQPLVVVDYAHTPDALQNVLQSLRSQTQGRLICVFGCGGNRDAGKRPLMGQVASELADQVWITTDNPRDEVPAAIAQAVLAGVTKPNQVQIELDRASAIKRAIQQANSQDTVLVAGKGHEDYQEILGVKQAFSDADIVQQALLEVAA